MNCKLEPLNAEPSNLLTLDPGPLNPEPGSCILHPGSAFSGLTPHHNHSTLRGVRNPAGSRSRKPEGECVSKGPRGHERRGGQLGHGRAPQERGVGGEGRPFSAPLSPRDAKGQSGFGPEGCRAHRDPPGAARPRPDVYREDHRPICARVPQGPYPESLRSLQRNDQVRAPPQRGRRKGDSVHRVGPLCESPTKRGSLRALAGRRSKKGAVLLSPSTRPEAALEGSLPPRRSPQDGGSADGRRAGASFAEGRRKPGDLLHPRQ